MTRTFIDSGVLIAAARGNDEVAMRAFQVLDDAQRVFVTSDFVRLEVLPKAIYHRNDDEAEFYETFFHSAQWSAPVSDSLVSQAHIEASNFGLSAVDALHIAAAKTAGAEELITTEKSTKPLFRVTGIIVTTIRLQ